MSAFEVDLVTYLRNHAGLSALIGQRIHPLTLPDPPVSPALVYQLITDVGEVAHDGPLDLYDSRYQFDAWATTYTSAKDVAAQLKAALLGFAGTMTGYRVKIPAKERSNDDYERETGLYRVSADYRIWIRPE